MTIDIDVLEVLEALDVDYWESSTSEVRGRCPAHVERLGKEDHNPSWYINVDTGLHVCFSCGWKGNLPFLVAYVLNLRNKWGDWDWEAVNTWLENFDVVDPKTVAERIAENAYTKRYSPPTLSESSLALFEDPPQWARQSRGLTLRACKKFGVLWNSKSNSWITPIRDPFSSKLLGWQEKGEEGRVFRNYPTGTKKRVSLFGFGIPSSRRILVESPLDVVRLDSVGVPGGVSSFGVEVSPEQVELLRSSESLVLALDNDEPGLKKTEEMLKLPGLPTDLRVFTYPDGVKDVGEMSKDAILDGLKKAKHHVLRAVSML